MKESYNYSLFENFQSTPSPFHDSYVNKNINQTMQQTIYVLTGTLKNAVLLQEKSLCYAFNHLF